MTCASNPGVSAWTRNPFAVKPKRAPTILILTGSFGQGHHTAASNLKAAFDEALPSEGSAVVGDFFRQAYPRTNALMSRGYGFAINGAPGLWKQLYRLADRGGKNVLPLGRVHRRFKAFLEREQPSAVVATFPGYPLLFEWLFPDRSSRSCPLFTVVTDAISINAVWCRGDSDLLFVADDDSKRVVSEELGFPAGRVRAHGFPLSPLPPGAAHEDVKCLPDARPRILYLPTTKTRHVAATLRAIRPWCAEYRADLAVVLGKHETRLRPVVEGLCAGALEKERFAIHGWRSDVPVLMRRHHLTLTKAGGATVSETLGARCPVLITYVVPGQEEGNAELVRRSECGRLVEDPALLPAALHEILIADGAACWHRYRRQLEALDRERASERIVADVLGEIRE